MLPGCYAFFYHLLETLRNASSLMPSCSLHNQQFIFKRFILQFVKSLCKSDRAAFRFWCTNIIPRGKLDINIDDEGDIFKLIEFLENDDQLSFTDMSLLKEFLSAVKRIDLLEVLKKVELRIAIGIILEDYQKLNTASLHQGSGNAVYADVVEFLVSTREKNPELISQALEQLRQAGEDYSVDGVIQECQLKPEFISWSGVTALLVIMAELYSEAEDFIKATIDLLADWMLELGGLKDFERFIRKKPKVASKDCAKSSIGESLKEYLKHIGHEVDKEQMN